MLNGAEEHDRYQAPAECVRAARAGIADVMQCLNSVASVDVDQCGDLLEQVATQLHTAARMLRNIERPGDAQLRFELEQLRRQLKRLAFALAESDRLVSGWVRRIGTVNGGYTQEGSSAPLMLVRKVNVTG